VGAQVLLRGRSLEGSESQHRFSIEAQQKANKPIAKPTLAIEEKDGMAVQSSWRAGWRRLLHRRTFNLREGWGKIKRRGCAGSARRLSFPSERAVHARSVKTI
jgi:hypothetical protein